MSIITTETPSKTKKLASKGNHGYQRFPIVQFHDAPPVDTSEMEFHLQFYGHREKKDLAVFAIMHCVRRTLPYGIWYCAGGREVLFNREFQPIAERTNGVVSYADRDEWVENIESATMFYDDACAPAHYLVKHLGYTRLSVSESKACRESLLRCLTVLKEFTPAESSSVQSRWSLLDFSQRTR